MKAKSVSEIAQEFLDAYRDPEIPKRLFFDVWADRAGCAPALKRRVWNELRRISYRTAAQKRQLLHQRKIARAEACRVRGTPGDELAA
jgi:hypothetical protein